MTHTMTTKLIFRLLYGALLMGEVAYKYFREVQFAHRWDPSRIYPTHNIFDPGRRSTYQYEFFETPLAAMLWRYTNRLIDHMNLSVKCTTIDQVLLAIYDIGGNSDINKVINLNLITLTLKAIWNTYHQQMRKWTAQKEIVAIMAYSKSQIVRFYKSQLRIEIEQLPHHINTIKIYNRYKDRRHATLERDKCVMRVFKYNRKRLRRSIIEAFEATWVKTGLVKIEGQNPSSLQIGPILVMGNPVGNDGGGLAS